MFIKKKVEVIVINKEWAEKVGVEAVFRKVMDIQIEHDDKNTYWKIRLR